MTRTLEDAERDYDRALEAGAAFVSIMQSKLERQRKEHIRTLGAVVLAAGGRVEVDMVPLVETDLAVTIANNPATGGFTVTARRVTP